MSPDPGLAAAVDRLAGARVLCVGDVMLDRFVYGHVDRISPEEHRELAKDSCAFLAGHTTPYVKRLEKQMRRMLKAQKKLLKSVAKPTGPLAGAGAILGALAVVAQKLGWGEKLEHALADLRDRFLPAGASTNGQNEHTASSIP